jgi:hypothetical protein
MYDKMFIIDLMLDEENEVKEKIKIKLEEYESRKLFNHRTVERGARIVCCSRNRVIFYMSRGNL